MVGAHAVYNMDFLRVNSGWVGHVSGEGVCIVTHALRSGPVLAPAGEPHRLSAIWLCPRVAELYVPSRIVVAHRQRQRRYQSSLWIGDDGDMQNQIMVAQVHRINVCEFVGAKGPKAPVGNVHLPPT